MTKVEIKNLTKRYGNVLAVDNVNLKIEDKEFVVLLGPSGSGKTTTLRCIAGLETPDAGEICIDGEIVNDIPPGKRDIAMVFQSYALYPHMTVYDNIAFPLKLRKYPKSEIEENVKKAADMLRISHLLDRKPRQLSGGEQQRVALARAIVRRPRLFLMDEPLSNLDAKLRVYARAELKKMQKELGITTIYVTHDQVEAMTMADKVAIYNAGKINQFGPPFELYDKPSNMFVAGFIGSPPMNFFDCEFVQKQGKVCLNAGEFTLSLPKEIKKVIKKEGEVNSRELVLGVRPEDVHLAPKVGPKINVIEAQVYVVEPLGPETIIDFKIKDNIYKMSHRGKVNLRAGDKINIFFNMEKIHLFDKKTGKAII